MEKKFQKLYLKDFVKDPSSLRLKSIRCPRDLSLGGNKLRKKEFKPNLNVVRNKNKNQNNLNRVEKPNLRPRIPQDKMKQRFKQSVGIFTEGIGTTCAPYMEKRTDEKKSEKNVSFYIPTIEKHQEVDKKTEERVYNDIVGRESPSEMESEERPPFKAEDWSETVTAMQTEMKAENILPELLDETTLSLWQMPTALPFKVDVASSKTSTAADCSLTDLPEGKIGNILVRKSGKVEAVIGNIKYNLGLSQLESFYETLVSINIVPEKSETVVLGQISSRFALSPNWSCLMTQAAK